ncbi:replication initiation protein [Helicobacter sp. WB40]|uniref:replication initiation protein n=1 Tax=Helicobacter sp. WB40 TaxID=3004130 RepID=UPI0022EBF63F|nr:replication initiation protein [Helicobacter sp. WB40]MDA3967229.1 replication initiation protein [Helicobacter sp. WB40]
MRKTYKRQKTIVVDTRNPVVEYHNDFSDSVLKNKYNKLVLISFRDILNLIDTSSFENGKSSLRVNKKRFYENLVFFATKLSSLKFESNLIYEDGYRYFKVSSFFEEISVDERLEVLAIKVSNSGAFFINNIIEYYTKFELKEFCSLRGKYSKNLYRLLKQFNNLGECYIDFNKFRRLMGVSSNLRNCDFDRRILNPAITMLNQNNHKNEPYFKNLLRYCVE